MSIDKEKEVLRWLDCDTYKLLHMRDNPERIWYAMIVDDVRAIHNGIDSGYVELEFRTSTSTTLTPSAMSEIHRIRGNSIIEFINKGHFDCKPTIHIEKHGNGSISIYNLSNDTGDFKFMNLKDAEKVSVDFDNKEMEKSGNTHRYDDFNKNYLMLKRGLNRLRVVGDFD